MGQEVEYKVIEFACGYLRTLKKSKACLKYHRIKFKSNMWLTQKFLQLKETEKCTKFYIGIHHKIILECKKSLA